MTIRKWVTLLGACALLLPVLASCGQLGGANTGGLDRAACPELGGGAMSANFTEEAKANATLRAFVTASGDLMTVATAVEQEVANACLRMGADLGVPAAEMAPRSDGNGARVQAACSAVDARIDAILRAGVSAQVKATVTPPECRVQANAYASCAGQCNVNVDPGYIVAHCEPGKLSGMCSGVCTGQCDGSCHGDCNGNCSAKNAQGQCDGHCAGTCHGKCDATCHAQCDVQFQAPKCDVQVKAPTADAQCDASCKAHADITAQCTEARASVVATVNTGEMPKLIATLTANLPALVKAEIAYGKRIGGDIQVLVQVGADLPQVIGQASAHAAACMAASVDAVASAQASISISVQASASISGKAGAGTGG